MKKRLALFLFLATLASAMSAQAEETPMPNPVPPGPKGIRVKHHGVDDAASSPPAILPTKKKSRKKDKGPRHTSATITLTPKTEAEKSPTEQAPAPAKGN